MFLPCSQLLVLWNIFQHWLSERTMLHFLWSKQLLTRQWHSLSIFSKWTNSETVTLSAAEIINFFAKVLPFKYILITSAFMPLLRGQAWNCYLVSAHCAARSFLESLFRFVEKNRTKKTLKRIDARAQNLLCIVFHPFVFCDAKSRHLTENLVVCELLWKKIVNSWKNLWFVNSWIKSGNETVIHI